LPRPRRRTQGPEAPPPPSRPTPPPRAQNGGTRPRFGSTAAALPPRPGRPPAEEAEAAPPPRVAERRARSAHLCRAPAGDERLRDSRRAAPAAAPARTTPPRRARSPRARARAAPRPGPAPQPGRRGLPLAPRPFESSPAPPIGRACGASAPPGGARGEAGRRGGGERGPPSARLSPLPRRRAPAPPPRAPGSRVPAAAAGFGAQGGLEAEIINSRQDNSTFACGRRGSTVRGRRDDGQCVYLGVENFQGLLSERCLSATIGQMWLRGTGNEDLTYRATSWCCRRECRREGHSPPPPFARKILMLHAPESCWVST
uniref:sterile alpha motif domain-containing protein 1-like n=1 Tax=Panthera onca TaxID=9690 RepID=UPI002952EC39